MALRAPCPGTDTATGDVRHTQASSAPSIERALVRRGRAITYVDHYLTHAANGVFHSPFETAALLVVDGRGETHTGMMARADGHKIEVLAENFFPHSLGLLYGAVTQFLGFTPDGDEWKVMALAVVRGRRERVPRPGCATWCSVGGRRGCSRSTSASSSSSTSGTGGCSPTGSWTRSESPARQPTPSTRGTTQIAAALQRVFEEVMTALLDRLHEQDGPGRRRRQRRLVHEQRVQRQDRERHSVQRALHRWLPGRLGDVDRCRAVRSRAPHRATPIRVAAAAQLLRPRVQRRGVLGASPPPFGSRPSPGRRPVAGRGRGPGRRQADRVVPGALRVRPASSRQPVDPRRPSPGGREGTWSTPP